VNANPIWGDDWPEVRRLWLLDPNVAHCNHGSFGAVPAPVLAVQEQFRHRMVTNPMEWFHRDMPGLLAASRVEIAQFFGAEPTDLALVTNVSTGVSTVLQTLAAKQGDEILTTNHVYGSVSLAVNRFCARTGATRVSVDIPLEATDAEVTAAIVAGCSQRTILVVVDHIASATARRFPVEAIATAVHERGAALLVDGAHAPAMLPIDIPSIDADFWLGNLHKWPCAPAGTAVLWVAPRWQDQMLPLVASGNGSEGFPASFDRLGTNDLSAWLAAPSALRLLGSLGWDRVRAHNEALALWGQATVAEALGVPESDLRHDSGLSMTVVPLLRRSGDARAQGLAIQEHLVKLGIETQMPTWNGRVTIRLSAHVYNQPSDYERIALGVRDALAS
jgi:isopenicillin-N epimerase